MNLLMTSQSKQYSHHLYRLYWRLCLGDLCHKLELDATDENKRWLHEHNKRVVGVTSTADKDEEFMSNFIMEVCAWWAVEKGIFVRTNRKQPVDIQYRSFLEVVNVEGEKKRIIDLL